LVDEDLRHHQIRDVYGDDHGVILVDGVDAFEIFVGECYERKASRLLCVDVNIFDSVEMTFSGLDGQPFIKKSSRNDVDYTSNLLGGFGFLLLLRLTFTPLRVTHMSSFLLYLVPPSISISHLAMVIMVPPELASNSVVIKLFCELG